MSYGPAATEVARFWVKVHKTESCWLWMASTKHGYGQFRLARGVGTARCHRYAYELLVGPIPTGLVLDHICHNEAAERGECEGGHSCPHRACVNPAHLEPVTRAVNAMRSVVCPSTVNLAKTHCVNGHEFTPENTHTKPNGHRSCRPCHAMQERRRWRAQRDSRVA